MITKCGPLKVSKVQDNDVKANIAVYSDSLESTYIEYLGCYTARASSADKIVVNLNEKTFVTDNCFGKAMLNKHEYVGVKSTTECWHSGTSSPEVSKEKLDDSRCSCDKLKDPKCGKDEATEKLYKLSKGSPMKTVVPRKPPLFQSQNTFICPISEYKLFVKDQHEIEFKQVTYTAGGLYEFTKETGMVKFIENNGKFLLRNEMYIQAISRSDPQNSEIITF